jgi:hypothetical protein
VVVWLLGIGCAVVGVWSIADLYRHPLLGERVEE